MRKLEILELLRELFREAIIAKTEPNDISGCSTEYFVDQDLLMNNIEQEISKEILRKQIDGDY